MALTVPCLANLCGMPGQIPGVLHPALCSCPHRPPWHSLPIGGCWECPATAVGGCGPASPRILRQCPAHSGHTNACAQGSWSRAGGRGGASVLTGGAEVWRAVCGSAPRPRASEQLLAGSCSQKISLPSGGGAGVQATACCEVHCTLEVYSKVSKKYFFKGIC